MNTKFIVPISLFILLAFSACEREEKTGSVAVSFSHYIDNQPLQLNQMLYTNAAENNYQVNEVKYFISKIYFITEDNQLVKVKQDDGIHYVDLNYPNTTTWQLDQIREGEYKAVQFVFGLDEEDNTSNRFPNPPECNFFWPQHLGGGYHYLQINGKWQPPTGDLKNFNFHTGIGQLYHSNVFTVDSIYAYVHNYITLTLPLEFEVEHKELTQIEMRMNIEQWFKDPYVYDFNYFGGSIMQNQNAQMVIKTNGRDVFKWYATDED